MSILWPNGLTIPPLVSSGFGPRNLNNPLASTYHRGTDFYGFPTVHSIADGEVVYVGWNTGVGWSTVAGYMVWVQSDGFFARYLHTDADTARVRVGDQVRAGDPLIDMGWSGLANPWDEHVHVEITPGLWHPGNTGQVDPYAWLAERVNGSAAGGGGIDVDPETPNIIESEEDDMRLIRINDSKSGRNGRHYAIAPEYIKQIKTAEAVKAIEDAFGITEKPISEWTLTRVLGGYGIPSGVLNGKGYVLDDLNGQGKHVSGGTWSRVQKVERLAYLAQKG